MLVQSWYNLYQLGLMGIILTVLWWPRRRTSPFHWKWSIPLISIFLGAADFVYFYALSEPDSMISIVLDDSARQCGRFVYVRSAALSGEKLAEQGCGSVAGLDRDGVPVPGIEVIEGSFSRAGGMLVAGAIVGGLDPLSSLMRSVRTD